METNERAAYLMFGVISGLIAAIAWLYEAPFLLWLAPAISGSTLIGIAIFRRE
jgi:hypothetical protein